MSPEQARGQAVDKRTDIWAFGCVLYEMLAGRRAFDGETISDTLVSVLERDPDWDALPARRRASFARSSGGACERIRRSACTTSPMRSSTSTMPPRCRPSRPVQRRPRRQVVFDPVSPRCPGWQQSVLAAALAWVGWLYHRAAGALPTEPVQLTIHPPRGVGVSIFALSPDGRYLAFAPQLVSKPMVWVHSLVTGETRALPSTEGARGLFWKPDSQEIAYFAGDQLKTVGLRGGSSIVVATVDPSIGAGTWGRSNVIIVTKPAAGLQKVSATGGTLEAATVLTGEDRIHVAAAFLPDGVHFLYVARPASAGQSELRVGSLESKEKFESLGSVESNVMYARGYLFSVRGGHIAGGSLTVQAFDPDRRRLIGDAMALNLPAAVYSPGLLGAFSVSAELDRLVYLPRTAEIFDLVWHNRSGEKVGTVGDPGVYSHLDISPDDERVAVSRLTQEPGRPLQMDIWTIDLKPGGGASRVTEDPGFEADPAWSGDGRQLAFNSGRLGLQGTRSGLFVRPSDGSGQDVNVVDTARVIGSPDWSLDNKHIIYMDDYDLWTVPMAGDRKPSLFLGTKAAEKEPVFSPDGRSVAYSSDSSGRDEVYIRAFPPG